jgi:uncharacterized protein YkwD
MARRGGLDHASEDGSGPSDRLRRAGLVYRIVGENLQMSRAVDDPVAAAIEGWLASAPHREVMLGRDFRGTGVGAALAEDGGIYFTQLFVRPYDE